ncbi:MAG TPA: serine hydrolase [Mycobacteriales bacterium]|nr:serine hydrolase [Mycobacteriales bacterium]
MGDDRLERLFDEVERDGAAYAVDIDTGAEVGWRADAVMNTGSAFKVAVALEVFCQAHSGRLDLDDALVFTPEKLPGETFPIVTAVEMMMQVSDNGATRALMQRVGQARIMRRLSELGLRKTFIGPDVWDELDAIFAHLDQLARTAGRSSWTDLSVATAGGGPRVGAEVLRTDHSAIAPETLGPVTTARELATLWAMIWRNQAGPPAACADVRTVAGETGRARIETGVRRIPGATFRGKGGGLPGLINNDAGVITMANGRCYAVAVLTRARTAFAGELLTDTQLATIATTAIEILSRTP